MFAHLLDCVEDKLSQPFLADSSVVAFDVSDLLVVAGLDIVDVDAPVLCSDLEGSTDILQAIIDPNSDWSAAPLDNAFQSSYDPCWTCHGLVPDL